VDGRSSLVSFAVLGVLDGDYYVLPRNDSNNAPQSTLQTIDK
jgi:hypothetical protein